MQVTLHILHSHQKTIVKITFNSLMCFYEQNHSRLCTASFRICWQRRRWKAELESTWKFYTKRIRNFLWAQLTFFSIWHVGPMKFCGHLHWPGAIQIPLFLHGGIQMAKVKIPHYWLLQGSLLKSLLITFAWGHTVRVQALNHPSTVHASKGQRRFAAGEFVIGQTGDLTLVRCTLQATIRRRFRLWFTLKSFHENWKFINKFEISSIAIILSLRLS